MIKVTSVVVIIIASIISIAAASLLSLYFSITTTSNVYAQLGLTPIPRPTNAVLPTYIVTIPAGAADRTSPIHYSPAIIAIPAGTTIAWFNDDPAQPHTVTSGLTNSSSADKGSMFNSGVMPYTSFFQHTFDTQLTGDIAYHCSIHPWRIGKVHVGSEFVQGRNFILAYGAGPILNLNQYNRTLLDFKPTTISMEKTTPVTYNITVLSSNNNNDKIFSRSFFALGNDLQIELIVPSTTSSKNSNNINTTGASRTTTTTVYGPDFTDPITGAYHISGNILKPNTNYKIRVELTAIGNEIPKSKIFDEFPLSTI
ncbi:MAG TPA: hypothetical protein VFJ05_00010 [Nitrososphaeraceae archaeon]|nr:hypothetical protein [Nitrososphaeraceae archaeon]